MAGIIGPDGGVNGRWQRGGVVDGFIYISKGRLARGGSTASTVRYNPANNTWQTLRDANIAATESSAGVLATTFTSSAATACSARPRLM